MAVHEEKPVIRNWNIDQVISERHYWGGGDSTLTIPPNGFLLAVTIKAYEGCDMPASNLDPGYRATFLFRYPEYEISPQESHPGDRFFYWQWPLSQCGIAFWPPIANVNAAHTFTLFKVNPKLTDDLAVTTVSLLVK